MSEKIKEGDWVEAKFRSGVKQGKVTKVLTEPTELRPGYTAHASQESPEVLISSKGGKQILRRLDKIKKIEPPEEEHVGGEPAEEEEELTE
jgi:hypothetical protein